MIESLVKHKLFPFFVFSVCLHLFVLVFVFYNAKGKDKFIQIPIDVNFVSPVEINNNTINETLIPNKQEIKQEDKTEVKQEVKQEVKTEIKETKVDPDSIKIAEKKKKKEKEKEKKKKEKAKEHKEKPKKETKKEEPVKHEKSSTERTATNTDNLDTYSNSTSRGVMFDNANFKFSYYTNSIVKKIRRNWRWSSSYTVLRAVIYFKIDRNGDIIYTKIKESSGDEEFDKNALRAVLLSSPFAPLPETYYEKDLGVYFEFKFN